LIYPTGLNGSLALLVQSFSRLLTVRVKVSKRLSQKHGKCLNTVALELKGDNTPPPSKLQELRHLPTNKAKLGGIMYQQSYQTKESQTGCKREWAEQGKVPATSYHTSIYALSAIPNDDATHNAKIKRIGNLVLDIDCKDSEGKPDIEKAIAETKAIGDYLESIGLNLDQTKLYASGSKGFHIIIPLACMGGIALPNLHLIHKYMVKHIETVTDLPRGKDGKTSLDMALYNGGMGQTVRVANKQRSNGAYKVQTTWQVLETLTADSYKVLCSEPRPLFDPAPPTVNNDLSDLFQDALLDVRESEKPMTALDTTVMNNQQPACMKALIAGTQGDTNTKVKTMNRMVKVFGATDNDIQTFAQNNPSKDESGAAIVARVNSGVGTTKKWGCGYALDKNNALPKACTMCKGCPVKPEFVKSAKENKLIGKHSTSDKHIKELVAALQTATGTTHADLGTTLCRSLAKRTPSKGSLETAIGIATDAGVPDIIAIDIIKTDLAARAAKVQQNNKITNFEGIRRVDISEPINDRDFDGAVDIIWRECDFDRFINKLAGKTVTVPNILFHDGGCAEYDYTTEEGTVERTFSFNPITALMNLGMGEGKTEITILLFKRLRAALLVAATITAHRTSLIMGLAEKFNVADYLQIENKNTFNGSYASCVDSLPQFNNTNPIFISDETRQTFEHVAVAETVGSNIKGGRARVFGGLIRNYQAADFRMCLDADMNDATVELLRKFGGNCEIILFESKPKLHKARHIILTGGHDESRHKIAELLEQGKKGIVGCTSQTECLMTAKWLIDNGHIKEERLLVITGENKGGARQADCLGTVNLDDYDLIIHSPVIGSGVSFVNPNFTFSVLMNTCVVTANEALQMLGRNRCAVECFISFGRASNLNRVTDKQIFIDAEKLRRAEAHFAIDNEGMPLEGFAGIDDYVEKHTLSPLAILQAEITVQRNDDLNDYQNNFVILAELNGRVFEYSGNIRAKFAIVDLKKDLMLDVAENRFNAEIIDAEKAKELSEKAALTQDESNALNRYYVTEMAGTDEITLRDVQLYGGGAFSQVLNFEMLQRPESELREIDKVNRETLNKMGSKVKEQKIINGLLELLANASVGVVQALNETKEPRTNDKLLEVVRQIEETKALAGMKYLKKHHKELSHIGNFNRSVKQMTRAVWSLKSLVKKYGFNVDSLNKNKDGKYTLKICSEIARYANNRAALRERL